MRKRLAIGSIVSRFVRLWYSVLATWAFLLLVWECPLVLYQRTRKINSGRCW